MELFVYERFSAGNALFKASRDYMIVIAETRDQADDLVRTQNTSFLEHPNGIKVTSYEASRSQVRYLDGQPYPWNPLK